MRRSRFSVEQIVAVLKQAELGMAVPDLICKLSISEETFQIFSSTARWYGGLPVAAGTTKTSMTRTALLSAM